MKLSRSSGCLLFLVCFVIRSQAQVRPPTGRIDSVQGALKSVQGTLKSVQGSLKKELDGEKASQAVRSQLDSIVGLGKGPLQSLGQGVKLFEGEKPVTFNQLNVEADYTYIQDTSGAGLGVFRSMQGMLGYSANYGVSLASMPFNMGIRESNGISTLDYTPFQNFYKFNFDHQQYLETLRSKLLAKLSPEAILNSALMRVNTIRQNYEQQLQGEISHMQGEFSRQYQTALVLPAGATNLSASDMGALHTQLIPGSAVEKYQKDVVRLQNMIRNKDPKTLEKDTNYIRTLGEVKKYEATEKIYGKIVEWKKRFEGNPLVKELRSQSSYSPGALKTYLTDPNNLGRVLDDQADLSTVQRLFYNITRLDLGQNPVQSGELSTQNVMNTGINTEFANKATSVGVIYGQNNSVNHWQQAGLTSQVTNEYSNLTGFKLGTGTGSPIDQSIAFNFFHFNGGTNGLTQPGSMASYLPVAPRQDGVISLHTGVQLGGTHSVTLDLSKSFGSFQQTVMGDSGAFKSPTGSVFNNAGKANYAGILNYTGEVFKTDVKLYIKKVGLGYNNPGNALLRSGESQVGMGLSRKFLRQKLSVKYDGDYRRQVFDPSGNYIYTALSNKLQLGYKITRNDRIGMTYQRSDYRSEFYGQSPLGGVNSRLQLDGNYRFTIDGKRIINTTTLSRQEMSIPLTVGGTYANNSLLLTQTSSMMVGKDLLSLTILDNRSDNTSYYFNTSLFSTEANYTYALAGMTRMSSCLGYYDNSGWNRQIGIRQQVSASIKEKVNMDIQVGYKKAVQIIRPDLANQLFVSAIMHYTFKK